ncbi:glycosyl transferase family 90-domain-containing protein [Lophiotrema nucula]|uniref:Glycosyl transferase family 90-domain-containing protein n=1 Tax=Lophiotrema nucula TaxID=690887 RepID=A0A6A5ZLJ8_9PLEO|nr:glycosyl transferase family 90-domain-containing protein [Lophiotrema nucula]
MSSALSAYVVLLVILVALSMYLRKSRLSLFRSAILSFAVITLCAVAFLFREREGQFGFRDGTVQVEIPFPSGERGSLNGPLFENHGNSFERLDLDEKECRANFPSLARDVGDSVARGKFVFEKNSLDYQGLVQGRIKNGSMYVLTTAPDNVPQALHQRTAILHQLHRALITSPSPLPDTRFAFVVNDSPKNNSWAFAKPNKPSSYNTWLMPHFGFWSWPSANLGTMDDTLSRIDEIESATEWSGKIDKVVWRGTPWFNPVGHPRLRQDLVRVAQGQEWADVEKFEVGIGGETHNALKIKDFCKYKYVMYTEGVTYSGRLPYHQACESVLLTPPLSYLTTTAWLMKPIDADVLLLGFPETNEENEEIRTNNSSSTWKAPTLLETTSYWEEANAIYVRPDFSNLEATVQFLRSRPDIARHISTNQRKKLVGGGFLSPAAEACYWRTLVRGWASVAVANAEEWSDEIGERFESWILKEVVERRGGTRGKNEGRERPT